MRQLICTLLSRKSDTEVPALALDGELICPCLTIEEAHY